MDNPQVVNLCDGLGTRLKEETEYRPKPMMNIGNKPILWYIMKMYSYYGFKDFILCLGYKVDLIKEYFYNTTWEKRPVSYFSGNLIKIFKYPILN